MSIEIITNDQGQRIGLRHKIDDEKKTGHLDAGAYREHIELLKRYGPLDTLELSYCLGQRTANIGPAMRTLKRRRIVEIVDARHCANNGKEVNVWAIVR